MGSDERAHKIPDPSGRMRRAEVSLPLLWTKGKRARLFSGFLYKRYIRYENWVKVVFPSERENIPQMTRRWTFGHGRRREKEKNKRRKKKGKVQIHNDGVATSERYSMVRYSDGASPRRRQHPCTWKVFIFNTLQQTAVFLGFFFTHMNENFTRILPFVFI